MTSFWKFPLFLKGSTFEEGSIGYGFLPHFANDNEAVQLVVDIQTVSTHLTMFYFFLSL
jgi:hypothetical protein